MCHGYGYKPKLVVFGSTAQKKKSEISEPQKCQRKPQGGDHKVTNPWRRGGSKPGSLSKENRKKKKKDLNMGIRCLGPQQEKAAKNWTNKMYFY